MEEKTFKEDISSEIYTIEALPAEGRAYDAHSVRAEG